MIDIRKTFIVDENNNKIAVQIDLETFKKIEEALENYALATLMNETCDSEIMSVSEAISFYDKLDKAK